MSAAPGQTPRLDSSNEEGTSLAGRGDWRRVYPPSYPVQKQATIRSNQFRVGVSGGARSAVALASRFDCRGVKKAAQRSSPSTFVVGRERVTHRPLLLAVGAGSPSLTHGTRSWQGERFRVGPSAEMPSGRVFSTEGAGARWSSLGRGGRQTELRANERSPWSEIDLVRRRRPEARAKGCRRASRLSPSSADGLATRNLRVPLARVSTHQKPIAPPKLERWESARMASCHEPGHGEETARSGDVHRPPTRLELEPTARKATSRAGFAMAQRVHEAPVVC